MKTKVGNMTKSKVGNMTKSKVSVLLVAIFLFVAVTVTPTRTYAQTATTVFNTEDFRTEVDGTLTQTNGSALHDPTTFSTFPVLSTLEAPNVENGAFRAPTGCTAAQCFNVAAIPIRGDGRITALFGGQDGVAGDANVRWGLEWLDINTLRGVRVQVRPNWQELRVELINQGTVDATHQIITLNQPLIPGTDRVGFEKIGNVFKVFVNGVQVSNDVTDATYTADMTDVVIGALAPSATTFPRWLWYAYTSPGDYVLGATSQTEEPTPPIQSQVPGEKLAETGQPALQVVFIGTALLTSVLAIAIGQRKYVYKFGSK